MPKKGYYRNDGLNFSCNWVKNALGWSIYHYTQVNLDIRQYFKSLGIGSLYEK